jgi:hypothetical protein
MQPDECCAGPATPLRCATEAGAPKSEDATTSVGAHACFFTLGLATLLPWNTMLCMLPWVGAAASVDPQPPGLLVSEPAPPCPAYSLLSPSPATARAEGLRAAGCTGSVARRCGAGARWAPGAAREKGQRE